MTDTTTRDETSAAEGGGEPRATPDADGPGAQAREWLAQLQSMIEQAADQAGPLMRQVGVKAAELAALAGEKAGPAAQRAADFTAEAGHRLAERSRDLAEELRGERQPGAGAANTTPSADPTPTPAAAVDPASTDTEPGADAGPR